MSTQENRSPAPGKKPADNHAAIIQSTEGIILLAGLAVAFLYMAGVMLSGLWFPEKFRLYAAMTAVHLVSGRAAGLSYGFAHGLGNSAVILVNMIIESALVLICYPLFVFSFRKLLVIKSLNRFIEITHRAAEANHHRIKKYGIAGLLLFVWFPFWMTGPLVGSVIGFLIGLSPLVNMTVVLSGTYLAMISWALLLGELHERLEAINPYAPMIFVLLLIAATLGINLWRRFRSKKEQKAPSPERPHSGNSSAKAKDR